MGVWGPGNRRHRGGSWQAAQWRKPGRKVCMLRSMRMYGHPSKCCGRQQAVEGSSEQEVSLGSGMSYAKLY